MEFMSSLQGGIDDLKPSLFELLSEQQLASLLPPSLRYLLALATHRNPRYLIRILNSFDEVYALSSLLVERYYLKIHEGGFTENFYGLKRERVLQIKDGEVPRAQLGTPSIVRDTLKLREVDVWKNIAVMVGIPYLRRKLDESYDLHAPQATVLGLNYNVDVLPVSPTLRQRVLHYYKWFLKTVYPSINAVYYLSLLGFNLAYLFDNSKYHSPLLWLIGTRIRRLGPVDYHAIEATTNAKTTSDKALRPGEASSLFSPRIFIESIYPQLLSSLRFLLPTSIFALKFLEWWHASDFARQLSRKATEGLELPPPVLPELSKRFGKRKSSNKSPNLSPGKSSLPKEREKQFPLAIQKTVMQPPISTKTSIPILTVPLPDPANSDLCPICNEVIATATASPYGYIFCYVCIHRWVEGVHDRQVKFMDGSVNEEEAVWGEDDQLVSKVEGSREGRWESGRGRCAVSGKRILGGTEALRRVVV